MVAETGQFGPFDVVHHLRLGAAHADQIFRVLFRKSIGQSDLFRVLIIESHGRPELHPALVCALDRFGPVINTAGVHGLHVLDPFPDADGRDGIRPDGAGRVNLRRVQRHR